MYTKLEVWRYCYTHETIINIGAINFSIPSKSFLLFPFSYIFLLWLKHLPQI